MQDLLIGEYKDCHTVTATSNIMDKLSTVYYYNIGRCMQNVLIGKYTDYHAVIATSNIMDKLDTHYSNVRKIFPAILDPPLINTNPTMLST